jgi:hypothetical protein
MVESMVLAHIAGVPVEETALAFGPVFALGGGVAAFKLRQQVSRFRPRKRPKRPA